MICKCLYFFKAEIEDLIFLFEFFYVKFDLPVRH
ncbi:MAG: hypothetical protein JWQ66_513, partial [Mucilaginibacter sp.]|nr:hypothetical protein [Mucilaginibacter sp.]